MMILGQRILTNHYLTESRLIQTTVEVRFPWSPRVRTRTQIVEVPRMEALQLPDGTLVMHPAMLRELERRLS